jgi:diguanylate cyclase (GGDEF)-like protein
MPKTTGLTAAQRLKEANKKMLQDLKAQDKLISVLKDQLNQAAVDHLTGLPNYNKLTVERIRQIVHQAERVSNYLIIFYFDLDGLRKINTDYGHEAGDNALRRVVDSMKKVLRASDYFIRKSGDEFLALMVMKKKPSDFDLKAMTKRLKKVVAENPLELGKKLIPLSISVGHKRYSYSSDFEREFAVADGLLYKDKARKNEAIKTDKKK